MSVTEVKQAIGRWNITLHSETPVELLNKLSYFGHIALVPGKVDTRLHGDNLLTAARYVGVYRSRNATNTFQLQGSGMAFWLGDEDGKGDVYETAKVFNNESFEDTIRDLLPAGGSIIEGTLHEVDGTYTGRHQWQTPREALTYVTDLFGAEWRVNNNGTLDAGLISDLYVTTPRALIVPKGFGSDLLRRVITGDSSMETNLEDITTRVVLLAEGNGTSISTGSANVSVNPYKDIHGNALKATRIVSESGTEAGNAGARAQLQLNRFTNPNRSIDLSTQEYDIKGTFVVGDNVHVYDPVNDFYDANNEIYWQGERINPIVLRCVEMTWPIPAGWTVAFRDINGNWYDLSEYYVPENGPTTLIVGELPRSISRVIGVEPVGVRPNLPDAPPPAPDTTIPDTPTFTAFSSGSYESDDRILAAIYAQWDVPLNQDSSVVTDGSHYEIRYRPNAAIGTITSWDTLSGGYNAEYDQLFNTPVVSGAWATGWAIDSGALDDFFVANGDGQISHPTFNILRATRYTTESYADVEVVAFRKINYLPLGASTVMGTTARWTDVNNTYWCRVEPNVDLTVTAKITKYQGGVYTELGVRVVPGITHFSGATYGTRMTISGDVISYKVWQGDQDKEPDQDTITVWDTGPITGTGDVGVMDFIVSGASNPANSVTHVESFRIRDLTPDNPGSAYSWDDLNTWDALVSAPVTSNPQWTTAIVGWDQTSFTLVELSAGVQYELQIRAIDSASPPNRSAWSTSSYVNTATDAIAPSTPAPPEVAASMIAVQLIHRLGKASGGTFNLEPDLHHFDVHASHSPTFFPDSTNKVGELLASGSMVRGGIPAVGTFKVDQPGSVWIRVVSVDRTGNKSGASEAVQSTVTLIDDAHISNLSVSKLTAGTITANSVLAAQLEIGAGGNIKITQGSLDVYDNLGRQHLDVGLQPDGSYDLAAIDPDTNERVNLAQLAFGMKADSIQSSYLITGSTGPYEYLPAPPPDTGPKVTGVRIGSSARALVIISAQIGYYTSGTGRRTAQMSFRIIDETTDTVTYEPYDNASVCFTSTEDEAGFIRAGSSHYVDASWAFPTLNGTYTFECVYICRAFDSGQMYFQHRDIVVMPF